MLYARLADLPLEIEGYGLEGLEQDVGRFVRRTTVVRLAGGGHEGVGEDVTYDAAEQEALQAAGPAFPLSGRTTLDGFSRLLDGVDLFPAGQPSQAAYRLYRRWAFESAALDLALRQAGTNLADALGLTPRPVRFVVSCGLGDPPSLAPVTDRLAHDPGLRFKLDPVPAWDAELIASLQATGAGVEVVDFKGQYHGTIVDNPADPDLYRRVAEAFPEAWIEDPALSPEALAVLEPHGARITWDAPVHAPSDVAGAPLGPPRALNVKPSRLGFLSALLRTYEYCQGRGIVMYGGGQFELGPGRGQLQVLASLFHPDGPNDVAPSAYNEQPPRAGLPRSPLAPALTPTGFRWA